MFKRINEFNLGAVGLGLTIGAGIGLLISAISRFDMAVGIIAGAGIGLVIGVLVLVFVKFD